MIYNTIKHDIRNKANLSLLDYCLLESIYLLSTGDKCKYKTWCNAAIMRQIAITLKAFV